MEEGIKDGPGGFTIDLPYTVGDTVHIVHTGKLMGVNVERVDIRVTGPDAFNVKYKLNGIKKLFKVVYGSKEKAALASYGKA